MIIKFVVSSFDRNAAFSRKYCIMENYSISISAGIIMKLHTDGHIEVMITISMSSFDRNAVYALKKYSKLHCCTASLLGASFVQGQI